MKALVTGIAGFIGSYVAEELLSRGVQVDGVDNLSTGHPQNTSTFHNKTRITITNFADENILEQVFDGFYDYVFHLAAVASVPFSVDHPVVTYKTNVSDTVALLDACRIGHVKKFIFSSSSAVYGDTPEPMDESIRIVPSRIQSPYALQKYEVENWCNLYSRTYGLPTACLRYFNVFGPRQKPDGAYANLISSWCLKAKQGKPLAIYGNGKDTRDYVYVKDVARANVDVALIMDKHPLVMNVGSGVEMSVSEIADIFLELSPSVNFIGLPARKGDVRRTKAEPGFLTNKIQMRGPTKELLEETFKYYQ